jgi:hypothetical protein
MSVALKWKWSMAGGFDLDGRRAMGGWLECMLLSEVPLLRYARPVSRGSDLDLTKTFSFVRPRFSSQLYRKTRTSQERVRAFSPWVVHRSISLLSTVIFVSLSWIAGARSCRCANVKASQA